MRKGTVYVRNNIEIYLPKKKIFREFYYKGDLHLIKEKDGMLTFIN